MASKNDKILAPIKNRIVEFIENQQIEKKFFFENLGVASSNFRGQALYSEVSADIIAKILSKYPSSNAEWFLLGQGSMLKEPVQLVESSCQPQQNDNEIIALLKENNTNLKYQLKDKEDKETLYKEKIADLEHRLELAESKDKEAMSVKIESQRARLRAKKLLISEQEEIILSQTGTINQQNEEINAMKSIHKPNPPEQPQPSKRN